MGTRQHSKIGVLASKPVFELEAWYPHQDH